MYVLVKKEVLDNIIISVVIPIYNVENYLSHCLDSLEQQSNIKNIAEILIVNDGSKDNSIDIAETFVQRTSLQCTLFNQQNQGLSAARNTGLKAARGEYVWFVDSDDWIEPFCLDKILSDLYKYEGVDVLQLQYRLTYEDGKAEDVPFWTIDKPTDGQSITKNGGLPVPAQFSIYRTAFLRENNLCFYPGILHEDSEFKPRACYLATSIMSVNYVCYNYLQRKGGSIMSTYTLKRIKDVLTVNEHLLNFASVRVKEKSCLKAFYRYIGMNMNSLLLWYRHYNKNDQNEICKMLCAHKKLFRCMMQSNSIKYQIEGLLFSISVPLGLKLHTLIR